jgi:hypothetical protein
MMHVTPWMHVGVNRGTREKRQAMATTLVTTSATIVVRIGARARSVRTLGFRLAHPQHVFPTVVLTTARILWGNKP